jgi:RHS repeat-associated protein
VTDGQGRQYAVGNADGYDYSQDNHYTMGGKFAGGTTSANSFDAERQPNPDQKKLSFFRNRFYDQETGRWTQEDPIGVAGGINLYAYTDNNPVNYTDPFGLCPIPPSNCPPGYFTLGGALTGATLGAVMGAGTGVAVAAPTGGVGAVVTVPTLSVSGAVTGAIVGGLAGAALDFPTVEFKIPRKIRKALEVLGGAIGVITKTDIPKPIDTDQPEEKPGIEEVIEGEWPPREPPPE